MPDFKWRVRCWIHSNLELFFNVNSKSVIINDNLKTLSSCNNKATMWLIVQSNYLSAYLSVCLSIYLSVYLSVCLYLCLSVCLCISNFVCPSPVPMFICASSLCLFVPMPMCLFVCLFLCLSVHLSRLAQFVGGCHVVFKMFVILSNSLWRRKIPQE